MRAGPLQPDGFAAAKTAALAAWEERKRTLLRRGAPGGRGYVDPDIVPLCDALNRLPGLFTLQSCAGHPAGAADGGRWPGALWLRLDAATMRRFEKRAYLLAAAPGVERLGKIYWPDGTETVTLTFNGNDTGRLARSGRVILAFFAELSC